jgi:hypothetical protein
MVFSAMQGVLVNYASASQDASAQVNPQSAACLASEKNYRESTESAKIPRGLARSPKRLAEIITRLGKPILPILHESPEIHRFKICFHLNIR